MGAVYAGQHVATGRMVAVKILHSELISNEELVHRFIREAQAEVAINHKNVIDVLDLGALPSGEPYMVMEYLIGAGLDEIITAQKQLDLPTACAVMAQTLHAISAAHDKGVVHRDLKPENIFINCPDEDTLEIKLIDFGISKIQDQDVTKLTQEGTTLGTPAYMSPEQVRGAMEMNHLTDIYAAGIIFYEMLSGDTPFEGKQYAALLANILTSEPRHPQTVNKKFPMAAWPVIQKAISKDPANRYQSAEEMLSAVLKLTEEVDRINGLAALPAAILLANSDKSIPPHLALADGFIANGGANGSKTDHRRLAKQSPLNAEATAETILHSSSSTETPAISHRRTGSRAATEDVPIGRTGPSAVLQGKLRNTSATIRNEPAARPGRKKKKGFGAVLFTALALLAGLAYVYVEMGEEADEASDDIVQIEIVDAPPRAQIFYDNKPMAVNPFRVTIQHKWTPIRVDLGNRTRMRFVVKPNRDMRIQYVAGETSAQILKDENGPSIIEPSQGTQKKATAPSVTARSTQAGPTTRRTDTKNPTEPSHSAGTAKSSGAASPQKASVKKKTATKSSSQKSTKTSQKKKPQTKPTGTAKPRTNSSKKRANPFKKLKSEIKRAFKD